MAAITKEQLSGGTITVRTRPGVYSNQDYGISMQDDDTSRVSMSYMLRHELQSVLSDYDDKRAKRFDEKFNNLPTIRRELGRGLTGVLERIEASAKKIADFSNLTEKDLVYRRHDRELSAADRADRKLSKLHFRDQAPDQSVYKQRSGVTNTRDYVNRDDGKRLNEKLISALSDSVNSISISLEESTKTVISNIEEVGRALVKGKYRGKDIILGEKKEGFMSKLLSEIKRVIALPVIGGVYTLLNGGSFQDAAKNGVGLSGAYLGSKIGSMFGFPGRLAGALFGYFTGKGFLEDLMNGKGAKQSTKDAASKYFGLGGAALGLKYGAQVGGWKGALVGGLAGGLGGHVGGQHGITAGLSTLLSIVGAAGGYVAFKKGMKLWSDLKESGTLEKISKTAGTIGDIGKGLGRKSAAGYRGFRNTDGGILRKTIGGAKGFHSQNEGIWGKIKSVYGLWNKEESTAINDADAAIGHGVRRKKSIWQRINELHLRLDAAAGAIGGRGRGGVGGAYGVGGGRGRRGAARGAGAAGGRGRGRPRPNRGGLGSNPNPLGGSGGLPPTPPPPMPPRGGSGGKGGGSKWFSRLKGKAGWIAGGLAAVGSYVIPDLAVSAITGMISDKATETVENVTHTVENAAGKLGDITGQLSQSTDLLGSTGGLLTSLEDLSKVDIKGLAYSASEFASKTTQKGLEVLSQVDFNSLYNTTLQTGMTLSMSAASKVLDAASSFDYKNIISSVTGVDPDKIKLAPSFVKGQQELNNALKELGSGLAGAAEKVGNKVKQAEKKVDKALGKDVVEDEEEGGFFSTLFKAAGLGGLGLLGYTAFKKGLFSKESVSKLLPSKLPLPSFGGKGGNLPLPKGGGGLPPALSGKGSLLGKAGALLGSSGILGLDVLMQMPDLLSGDAAARNSALGGIAGGFLGAEAAEGLTRFLPKKFQAVGKFIAPMFGHLIGGAAGSELAGGEHSGLASFLGTLGLVGGAGYLGYQKFGDKLPTGITDKLQSVKQGISDKLGGFGLLGGANKDALPSVMPTDVTPADIGSKPINSFEQHKQAAQDKIADLKKKASERFEQFRQTDFGKSVDKRYGQARLHLEEFLKTERGQKLADLYDQGKSKATSLYSTISDRVSAFRASERGQKLEERLAQVKAKAVDLYNVSADKVADFKSSERGKYLQERLGQAKDKLSDLYGKASDSIDEFKQSDRFKNAKKSSRLLYLKSRREFRHKKKEFGDFLDSERGQGLQARFSTVKERATDLYRTGVDKASKLIDITPEKKSNLSAAVSSAYDYASGKFADFKSSEKGRSFGDRLQDARVKAFNLYTAGSKKVSSLYNSIRNRVGNIPASEMIIDIEAGGRGSRGKVKSGIWNKIKGGAGAVLSGGAGLLRGGAELLSDKSTGNLSVSGGIEALRERLDGVTDKFKGLYAKTEKSFTGLGSKFSGLFGNVSSGFGKITSGFSSMFGSVKDKLSDMLPQSQSPAIDIDLPERRKKGSGKRRGKGFGSKLKSLGSSGANVLSSGAKAVGGGLKSLGRGAKSLLKGAGPLGLAMGALDLVPALMSGDRNEIASAGGSAAGGAIGAALGSFIPIPIVGTLLGGMVGSWIGEKIGMGLFGETEEQKRARETKESAIKTRDYLLSLKENSENRIKALETSNDPIADVKRRHELEALESLNKDIQGKQEEADANSSNWGLAAGIAGAAGVAGGAAVYGAKKLAGATKSFGGRLLDSAKHSKFGKIAAVAGGTLGLLGLGVSSLFSPTEAHADDSLDEYKKSPEYKKALQENAERASNVTQSELQGLPDATDVVSNVTGSDLIGLPDATDVVNGPSTSDTSDAISSIFKTIFDKSPIGSLYSLFKGFTKGQDKTNKELLENTDETNKVIQEAKNKGLFSRLWDKAKSFFGFGGGDNAAVQTASYESGLSTGSAAAVNRGGGSGGGGGLSPSNLNIPGSGELGALSARYESGSRGSSAVGYDTNGGTSYGKYQIAAKTGTMSKYINWLEKQTDNANAQEVAKRLRAVDAGHDKGGKNQQAAAEWQALVAEGKMGNLEHDFIKATHYDVAYKQLSPEAQQMVANSKTLQDVLWSSSVHHGPGGKGAGAAYIFNKAYKSGMTESQMIDAVYQGRSDYVANNKYRDSLQKRFVNERQLAQAMLTNERNAPSSNDAVTPQMLAANMPPPTGVSAATSQGLEAFAKTAVANKVTYSQAKGGAGRTIANGFIDCSGFGSEAMVSMMSSQTDSAGNKVYGDDALRFAQSMRGMTALGQRDALTQRVNSFQLNAGNMDQLRDGMYVTMKRGNEGHAGYVYRDAETGKWKFADSAKGGNWRGQKVTDGIKDKSGGVRISDLDEKLLAGAKGTGWDFMVHDMSQMANKNAQFDNMPKTALAENTATQQPSPQLVAAAVPTDTQIKEEVNSSVLSHASTSVNKSMAQQQTAANNGTGTTTTTQSIGGGGMPSASSGFAANNKQGKVISSPNVRSMGGPLPSPIIMASNSSPDLFNPVTFIYDPIVQKYVNEPDENTMVQV